MGRRTVFVSYRPLAKVVSPYLRDRSGEDNHLVQLAHSLHELIDTRPLDHIHVVILSFDLDGDSEIGLMQYLEDVSVVSKYSNKTMTNLKAAVDERLVQIKHQALLPLESWCNWAKQVLLRL